MPQYPGGANAILKVLTDDLRYPRTALRDGVQGKLYLSFVVDSAGWVKDIKIKEGLRADLDAEALRVANRLTAVRWKPGTQDGQPVAVSYTTPLTFRITDLPITGADSLETSGGKAFVFPLAAWPADKAYLPKDKGVIYGSCIPRGSEDGGLGQYVRLINLTSHKAVRISVKTAFNSKQEAIFYYALPPGRYALHSYEYSSRFGEQLHIESLRKPDAAPATAAATVAHTRYIFTVQPGQVQYVGTWDFTQPKQPAFTDAKVRLDTKAQSSFKHQNLADATTTIPK
jgi:TonB family protein